MSTAGDTAPAIDPHDLRRALGTFATGVTVVTTVDAGGAPRGFTANSFTSVSLDPPLVLVCLARKAASCPAFRDAGGFAVNILAETQKAVSVAFGSPDGKRFEAVAWSARATGSPVIEGAAAWLDCAMHAVVEAGDHDIFIGRVVDYAYGAENPLGYCRGAYVSFGLAERALRATEGDGVTRLSAIIERDGDVYLDRRPDTGALSLPSAPRVGRVDDPGSLLGRLAAAGVDCELSFLFAVYEDPATAVHNVVYRGEARGASTGAAARFVAFDAIPWDALADAAVRSMLERYVRERREDSFGVYIGDSTSGRVRPLGGAETDRGEGGPGR